MRRMLRLSTTPLQLYVLMKAACQLEDPMRHYARAKVATIMELRGLVNPMPEKPFTTPTLCHEGYRSMLQTLVRFIIDSCRDGCLPLHEPRGDIVEGSWITIKRAMHDGVKFLQEISLDEEVECVCGTLRNYVGVRASQRADI